MFKNLLFYSLLFLLLFFEACTIKSPVAEDTSPELSGLAVADTLYLQNQNDFSLSVHVTDPQGEQNIEYVLALIYEEADGAPVQIDTLKDDGTGGDILPGDGLFFVQASMDFVAGTAGTYLLLVMSEDFEGNTGNVLMKNLIVIDDRLNHAPTLTNPIVPDIWTAVSKSSIFLSVQVNDPEGLSDIDSVAYQIYQELAPSPGITGYLTDDELEGDIVGGDGLFSGTRDFNSSLFSVGNHLIRFEAFDTGGLSSPAVVVPFFVDLTNAPPVVSGLTAPDTLSRNTQGSTHLSVEVDDPQGAGDIHSVYFNTWKPDGSASGGNPFTMFDNGENGDLTANDGTYSLNITITAANDLGNYDFHFIAKDFSQVTDTLKHVITIVD